MDKYIEAIIKKDPSLIEGLFIGQIGLEKENVRIDDQGKMVSTKQPRIFGDKLENPFFYNDFSESQVELITPVFENNIDCYNFLTNINNIFMNNIGDELLWPQSAPPVLPDDEFIPIAYFGESKEGKANTAYREMLADKYGRKKQMICGLHYNFSFDNNFLKRLYNRLDVKDNFKTFKNNVYLKISRNFIRHAWMLTYLFGASPLTDETYVKKCLGHMNRTAYGDPYFEYGTSMRNGVCGYRNHNNFILDYYSIEQYLQGLKALVDDGKIYDEKEYYSPIRLKTHNSKSFSKTLLEKGITYLEIRILDIDPFDANGISLETLRFMQLFMVYLLFKEEDCFGEECHEMAIQNYELVAGQGRKPGLELFYNIDESIEMKTWGMNLIDEMVDFLEPFGILDTVDKDMFSRYKKMFEDTRLTKSACVLEHVWEKGYIPWHLELAKYYKALALDKPYELRGCESLELSTQILMRDALMRGIHVEFLDKSENFIQLKKDDHIEYIKQATKTRLDSYSTFLVMENKLVTKEILNRHGILVPAGGVYDHYEKALKDYNLYSEKAIVIKPKSTNFGIGITIFKQGASLEDYQSALKMAFKHDHTVLIEEFVPGKEYRFIVIGDEVAGILHRVPANVVGDGRHNIAQLIDIKNNDPLRGKGYKTPLELIQLGQVELMFLKEQGFNEDTILQEGQCVYLRENSNISTGGDSIDFTDEIHQGFKDIAVTASKAVGARICGVDMMLQDIHDLDKGYAIIELNFNPAIHIHCYPFKGENRDLGNKILDVLGY